MKLHAAIGTLLGIAIIIIVNACTPQEQRTYTKTGIARDTVFSVEQRGNGATVLWLTHDDVTAYCFDKPVNSQEMINHDGDIVLHYQSIVPDSRAICYRVEPSVTTYLITEYSLVNGR